MEASSTTDTFSNTDNVFDAPRQCHLPSAAVAISSTLLLFLVDFFTQTAPSVGTICILTDNRVEEVQMRVTYVIIGEDIPAGRRWSGGGKSRPGKTINWPGSNICMSWAATQTLGSCRFASIGERGGGLHAVTTAV